MAKRITKYYQECDFCHKEFEVSSGSLDSITLPGRYVDTDGYQLKQWIKADICPECKERLREHLVKAVDIREDAYYGTNIHWLDDKGENNGEKNDG